MGTLALAADERVANVRISEDELIVRLRDGRTISVPLVWYPRLLNATEEQRNHWQIIGAGYGIHWEEIDEDLSSEGLLRGAPAPRQAQKPNQPSRGVLTSISQVNAPDKGQPAVREDLEDDLDKGFLDHLVEGEEAAMELVDVLIWIQSETSGFTTKLNKHTSNIDRLANQGGGSTAKDLRKLVLLAASDMNAFSRRIEDLVPKFEKSTKTLEDSYSVYVSFAKPESPTDVERIGKLRNSLTELLKALRPAKEGIANFRDSSAGVRSQNISKELNKAALRQSHALDSVLSETERVESFALKISFLIDERFGPSPTT